MSNHESSHLFAHLCAIRTTIVGLALAVITTGLITKATRRSFHSL